MDLLSFFRSLFGFGGRKKKLGSGYTGGYIIQIRLYGPEKKYIRHVIYEVARKFGVRANVRKRTVPHVTLYGTFSTNDVRRLTTTFESVCNKYAVQNNLVDELVMFRLGGFKSFQGESERVICLDVLPSEKLLLLTKELTHELNKFCRGAPWDYRDDKIFHVTIAFRGIKHKHDAILTYLKKKKDVNRDFPIMRISIIKPGRKILVEYDLILNKLLCRNEAKSHEVYRKSVLRIKKILECEGRDTPH
ncbi:MAG: 2'-5' RNA ligase family protein [Candidatus Micrarchaeota archaeon]